MQKNSLTRKIKLTSKFIKSQPGKQTIAIHILTNISISKGNQTKKFGQLIEYNIRIIFLLKSYTKYGGEAIPRPFSWFLEIYDDFFFFLTNNYCWCVIIDYILARRMLNNDWTFSKPRPKLQTTCSYLICFNRKRCENSLLAWFSAWFLKNNISLVMFYYLTKLQCLVALGNMCIITAC